MIRVPAIGAVRVGHLGRGRRDASGLTNLRNRYYDATSGRFTQQDPIGLAGGLNLYGFAGGDPINYQDPFGLCKKGVTKDQADKECRDANASERTAVLSSAATTSCEYKAQGRTYDLQDKNAKANTADCSSFVTASVAGAISSYAHHNVASVVDSKSTYWRPIGAEEAGPGDLITQGGHMGIYTGVSYPSEAHGRAGLTVFRALDMGGRFPRKPIGEWGPGGYINTASPVQFFRLQVPR